jgi:hypothetical protein
MVRFDVKFKGMVKMSVSEQHVDRKGDIGY